MPHENPCPPTNTCPACGAAFTCGMQAGLTECWCAALPPLLALPATGAARNRRCDVEHAAPGCHCERTVIDREAEWHGHPLFTSPACCV